MSKNQNVEAEKEDCATCGHEMTEPYWGNLSKGFCSLKCTNEYLEGRGFLPISGPNESAQVNPEYL